MTDTSNRPLTVPELHAMFEATDNAAIAAERSSLPDWLREDDRHGPGPAPLRTLLIADYLEAKERSEEGHGEAEERLLRLGEQFGAARALARYLVDAGEYATAREATDAIEAGRVVGFPTGRDLSEVPF
ncbi:hypothetical protein GCM10027447_12760 [Glycomyces halotolerans]